MTFISEIKIKHNFEIPIYFTFNKSFKIKLDDLVTK